LNNGELHQIKSGIYNKGDIELDSLIKSIKNDPRVKKAGAILTFIGIVRETSQEGRSVKGMLIDSYDDLANNSIENICNDIIKQEGIVDIKIVHLKGEFQITDDLVYVVVASEHREEGFQALRNAVERYKKEVAVWKKEEFINGSSKWVH
jgi:molybdopterin synthase catalytic subunit